MTLAKLINTPCTIVRKSASGTEDVYGNLIPSEEEIDAVCEVQQKDRGEQPEGEPADADWLGIFPAGTDLDANDSVIVDGLGGFELIGAPWPARNPRTRAASHIEATLRRVAGAGAGS